MIPRITTPPAAELDAIHEAMLRVLADVGVRFPHAGAQAMPAEAGAAVDAHTGLVRIPPRLVEGRCRSGRTSASPPSSRPPAANWAAAGF